ncbi:MAG: ribonuclease G, partial [Polaromonas sp.]
MKGRLVVLDKIEDRAAAALIVDGRLEDVLIDPPER